MNSFTKKSHPTVSPQFYAFLLLSKANFKWSINSLFTCRLAMFAMKIMSYTPSPPCHPYTRSLNPDLRGFQVAMSGRLHWLAFFPSTLFKYLLYNIFWQEYWFCNRQIGKYEVGEKTRNNFYSGCYKYHLSTVAVNIRNSIFIRGRKWQQVINVPF